MTKTRKTANRSATRRPAAQSVPPAVPASGGDLPNRALVVGAGGDRRSVLVTSAVSAHDDPIEALRDLAAVRQEVEDLVGVYVRRARSRGLSWDAIGVEAGVPGETLRRRYSGA